MQKKGIDFEQFVPEYLRKSDRFYALITDMVGSYVYVNKYFKKKFSFVAEDFVGLPLDVAMHVEDNGECQKAVEKLFQKPDAVVPVRVRKPADKQGAFFWSDWEFSFVKNDKDEPIGVLCVGVDSSEQQILEKNTNLLKNEFDGLVQTMKDPFFSLDKNWKYTRVNPKLLELYNCNEDDLLGKSYWSTFIDSESNTLAKKMLKVMSEQEILNTEEYFPTLDKYLNIVAYPSVKGINVYLFDVTIEKKRQKKLVEQRNELERLLAENGVFMEIINQVAIVSKTDLRGRITYVNDQFIKWSKYSEEELLGENHRILKSDEHDDAFFDDLWQTISRGKIFRGEIKNKAKDGSIYWVDTIISPIFDKSGVLKEYFAIRFVVNDRKESEKRLEEKNKKLRKIAWEQSHEIRKPLANIEALVQLIQYELVDKVDMELIDNLNKSTLDLDKIIHNIAEATTDEEN